ncbi:hypothetical protein F0562_025769 [Nyssa sinensis]|uniref:Uncharacterized protein n=1 Tax=Nyssa sinensis TaxID=561372 RepID=A0A5J5BBE3_9ASTE|nr:hypothetical protein F0562_025769 [Nyssa sinensis]
MSAIGCLLQKKPLSSSRSPNETTEDGIDKGDELKLIILRSGAHSPWENLRTIVHWHYLHSVSCNRPFLIDTLI